MNKYNYFVSYHASSKSSGDNGFGNVVMSTSYKIDSSEALTGVMQTIAEKHREDYDEVYTVVILNFQLLREVPEHDG